MGFYAKAYKGNSSGGWAKVSTRGLASGQRIGGSGPVSFGVATGTRRGRRGSRSESSLSAIGVCFAIALVVLCLAAPALFVVALILAPIAAIIAGAVSGIRQSIRDHKN